MKNIGLKIYNLRTSKNMSQEDFGNIIGVSRQTVSKWEMGLTKPGADYIKIICDVFEISPDCFLSGNASETSCNAAAVAENQSQTIHESHIYYVHDKKSFVPAIVVVALFCAAMTFVTWLVEKITHVHTNPDEVAVLIKTTELDRQWFYILLVVTIIAFCGLAALIVLEIVRRKKYSANSKHE